MHLLTHAAVLCLLGLMYSYSSAAEPEASNPTVYRVNRRFLEAKEIENFGKVTNDATKVIEKLTSLFQEMADPAKGRKLREGPLGDRIRAAVRTGNAFVSLIESISAAIELSAA
ncbi:uncharacterized protein LOC125031763 [Penaeus chinensis]|uniref:uncharacterized protein LOC125031763 n=1 Tax=Penaeus chinensis TaxID=139456 RepID=UPI001FB5CA57|nr:uncharacterized protein LOC125031763 [Penaeus chinensis]